MRALVVSNMRPSPEHPARGIFVRDQVAALRRRGDVDIELFEFPPGLLSYATAAATLRRRHRRDRFDIVHAHFGLTAWPALAVAATARLVTLHGTDVRHPRSRRLTLAAATRMDLVATVSEELGAALPNHLWTGAVLPCGVELERFRAIPRDQARRALDLEPDRPCLLFPADPARAVKRFDRAQAVAGDTPLITLGDTDPAHVPLAINAANAVLVPSDDEGFGLAVLEALACDVPVLATPVGIHREALAGIDGVLCDDFDVTGWRAALSGHLAVPDPRIDGRSRAAEYSADAMAERVAATWRALISD